MKINIKKLAMAPLGFSLILGTLFVSGASVYADDDAPEPDTIYNFLLSLYRDETTEFTGVFCQTTDLNGSCDAIVPDDVPIGGYRVIGWADTVDATEPLYHAGDSIMINKEGKRIYAVYDYNDPAPMPLVYAVNFFIDGVGMVEECSTTSGVPCMFTIPEDSEFGEELSKKDGYKFLGWATTEGATEPEYVAGDEVNILETGTDFFAVWEEESDEKGDDEDEKKSDDEDEKKGDDEEKKGEDDDDEEESVKVPDTGMFTGGDNGSEMKIALTILAVSVFAIVAVSIARKNSRGHYTYK